jgi:hypothetical protein
MHMHMRSHIKYVHDSLTTHCARVSARQSVSAGAVFNFQLIYRNTTR